MAEKKKEKKDAKKGWSRIDGGVEILKGFYVRCEASSCGGIGFAEKAEAALAIRENHKKEHARHESLVQKHVTEAKDGTLVPMDLCPGRYPDPGSNTQQVCGTKIGRLHVLDCDMAVCAETGRLVRELAHKRELPAHECKALPWTGFAVGEKEANQYGISVQQLFAEGLWGSASHAWYWEPTPAPFDLSEVAPEAPEEGTLVWDTIKKQIVVFHNGWWDSDPKVVEQYGYKKVHGKWIKVDELEKS